MMEKEAVVITEVKTILESIRDSFSLSFRSPKFYSQLLQHVMVLASLLKTERKKGKKELREMLCVVYT